MAEGTTYVDPSVREDLLDLIYQITPDDTPLFNLTADTDANSIFHEWMERSLVTRQDNAQLQGATFTKAAPNLPKRVANFTQIQWKSVTVTRTNQRVRHAAIADLFGDQLSLRMTELKTDAEHALNRGSLATGNASNAEARMAGLLNVLTTNSSTHSLVSLSETMFGDLIQKIWDSGGRPRHVFVHGTLKRRISSFSDKVQKFEDVRDRRATRTISVYESDLAQPLEIMLSRDQDSVKRGDASESVVVIDIDMFAKAWIDRPFVDMLAKTADSLDGVVLHELTFEYGNQAAGGGYFGVL